MCAFLTYLVAKKHRHMVFSWLIYTQGQGNQVEEHTPQIKEYPMSLYCNRKITLNLMILNKYIKDYI